MKEKISSRGCYQRPGLLWREIWKRRRWAMWPQEKTEKFHKSRCKKGGGRE